MDISQFDVAQAAAEARPLPIHAPNGEKTDIVLHVLGYDSDQVVEAVREVSRAGLGNRSNKPDLMAMQEAMKRARVKAAIVGWENLGIGEDQTEFSSKAVDALLDNRGFSWIIDQVENFAGDRANLFQKPPKD